MIAELKHHARALARRGAARLSEAIAPTRKETLAAGFFINHFGNLTPSEMDALVDRYWRDHRRLEAVLDASGLDLTAPDLRLLDIGGGYSTALRLFRSSPQRWVLDICTEALYAGGLSLPEGVHYLLGAGERVPFPEGFFDAIFCTNVLDHTDDPARVMSEIHRALKPGGVLILAVDLFFDDHHEDHRDLLHPHSFEPEDLPRLIERFERVLETTQSDPKGKVGLGALVKGDTRPRTDRQEHLYVLRKPL
ncbi:class I SAM-dependent methyltransferase [Myxococcota bacterium]|nr:class I SAM-dependent methyltransferase [Myxococcota bacterium]MBU1430242.1 class I SAM-dependent methyltransferase [Myxococcota bacterium]MBU1898352.1 class I SAM-dependent methyltransferase [Myxococcota bacterium]